MVSALLEDAYLMVGGVEILSSRRHSTLHSIEQLLLDLPHGCLLEVLQVLFLHMIRLLLLFKVLLAYLADVQLLQFSPACDSQTTHILGLVNMHLNDRVDALQEAAIS